MNVRGLLEFFEPPISIGFDVEPTKALEFLRAKGLRATTSYMDMSAEEHANAFTIAGMMDMDMLADVKNSLESAMASGKPFKEWASEISPMLESRGWLGTQENPAWRLETIFRTNMQSAYAAGQWEQIKAQSEIAPFLMYDAVDDFRTRPEHAARDEVIQPITWIGWKRGWYPPCGWNCRCGVIQLSQDDLDDMGLQVSPKPQLSTYEWENPRTGKTVRVPMGNDPGFDANPGDARTKELKRLAEEKVQALTEDLQKAAAKKIAIKPPLPPVDPYPIPEFIPQRTVAAAARDAEQFLSAKNSHSYQLGTDGLPAVRFRHSSAKYRADVWAKKYGLASYSGLDVDTANAVSEWLRLAAAEADRLAIPRLRGVNTAPGRAASASMGDGVLALSRYRKVTDTPGALLEQRRTMAEQYNRWSASDGNDGRRPSNSGNYFATSRDSLLTTMWHEFAHHIHQQFRVTNLVEYKLPPLEVALKKLVSENRAAFRASYPTEYSLTNAKEYFAECYALYKMGRSRLVPKFMLDFIAAVERGELP